MRTSLSTLLVAMLMLELGSGLQGLGIPIQADRLGFSTTLIGALGTAYYVGFVSGCLALPGTVRRVGHIRCFAALAAIAASTMLVHALVSSPWVWILQRATFGFCFAGLFMVVESWLNDSATTSTRGRLLSMYMAVTWIGVILGKLVFPAIPSNPFYMFAICSMAVSLSLVPIVLTNGSVPSVPKPARFDAVRLLREAPVGLVGAFAVGAANGAFWTFAPLFAETRSGSSLGVGVFMASCALGGALSQWPLGRLSDRMDRRWVIFGSSVVAAGGAALLALELPSSLLKLCAMGALFGAAALPIYSLCVAHTNDRADPGLFIEVSSLILLVFGVGAMLGPFTAGLLIEDFGLGALFSFTACIHVLAAAFSGYRTLSVAAAPPEERASFSAQPPMGQGTQAAVQLAPSVSNSGVDEKRAEEGDNLAVR